MPLGPSFGPPEPAVTPTDGSVAPTDGAVGERGVAPEHERILNGVAVSPGVVVAPVYLYARAEETVEERTVPEAQRDAERLRFAAAVERAERDLDKIGALAREKLGDEHAGVFEAQAMMLADPELTGEVSRLLDSGLAADAAVHRALSRSRDLLLASDSPFFRDRAADLADLEHRLLVHLRRGTMLSKVDEGSIVVAPTLTAADVVLFSRRGVKGIVLQYGGATGHVSIMARALGLPAVVGVRDVTATARMGEAMILDGVRGRVIVRPEADTTAFYAGRIKRYQQLVRARSRLVPLPPVTPDGHRVTLRANLEFEEELGLLKRHGAEGVGLFRSEIMVLMRRRVSVTEDEQFAIYRSIAEATAPHGTTFRVLDLGGDKMLPVAHREANPFLGWRGLRVLLDRVDDLLVPQLRALLRASAFGPVRLLLPMVTDVGEVRAFREILDATREDLRREGVDVAGEIPLGIMVEVPAVALMAERFAPHVDFFSIGTNDLTQYALAVDRGNDLVARLFDELHPGVLHLVHHTIQAGHRAGLRVSLCGELAAKPYATPILLGLGLDEFSLSPIYLSEVKEVIRASPLDAATDLAQRCLLAPDAATVRRMAAEFLDAVLPGRAALADEPMSDSGPAVAGDAEVRPMEGLSAAPDRSTPVPGTSAGGVGS